MPTHVEISQQGGTKTNATVISAPKLGARAVVELLKHNQPNKIPAEFTIIENRTPEALQSLLQFLTRFQLQIAKSPYANASVLSLLAKYLVENKQCFFIAKPDVGAISLVDRIFDKLLNSDKFDREAWRLLVQIRFPITKFALQDFSFFFAPQNIGRRLLNTITLYLMGATGSQDDQVRDAIEHFVSELNIHYRSNVSEFNSVCIETQSWFASQQRQLSKIENKVSQIQKQGKNTDRSEPCLIDMLNKQVGGKELPELLVDFIYGEWKNSLRLVLRQYGASSADWKRQVGLTQSMVKIYQDCQNDGGKDKYTRFLPSMLKSIKGLLISVIDDADAFENAIDPLELVLNAIVRGADPELKSAPMLREQSVVDEVFEVVPIDEKYLSQIENMNVGEWIRMKSKSNQYEACKLTVKGVEAEPWFFVNHTGKKIAKKNKYALAQGVRDGLVEVVGKGYWIDELLHEAFAQVARSVEQQKKAAPIQVKGKDESLSTANRKPQKQASASTERNQFKQEISINKSQKESAESSPELSLVDMEEQGSSFHVEEKEYIPRTEEILSGSALSIVEDLETNNAKDEIGGDESEWHSYYQAKKELTEAEIDAAIKAVETLEVGAIIVRITETGEQRCKLAVKMVQKNKYIFVDHLGIKNWDTHSECIAESIALGQVSIVDSGVKFDRALERVVMNIQADKKER